MDQDAKKTALRMIPYGIYVLTADDGQGNVAAATVNWVTQTAFAPPLVVVGVKTDSGAYQIIKDKKTFALNMLGKDQRLADIGTRLATALPFYAGLCGRTLARAHARSGDAVSLSGYIGDSTEFDKAIAEFARAYADQTEQDWRALLDAIAVGRIAAEPHAAGQPP